MPINFRLIGPETRFILENAGATALIVQDELAGVVEDIRAELPIPQANIIHFGERACPAGWSDYETLLSRASDREPDQNVLPSDPWTLMYTSGTTGNPKGVLRNNRSGALLSMVTEIELGVHRTDGALLVMPMCHANSLNFYGTFA